MKLICHLKFGMKLGINGGGDLFAISAEGVMVLSSKVTDYLTKINC